jgi:acetyl-CoA acetyltransferase
MDAYIVGAVRTAGAKKNGRLREWHPISLGAAVLDALVDRTGIDVSSLPCPFFFSSSIIINSLTTIIDLSKHLTT